MEDLIAARKALWLDFFGGWTESDKELLEPYQHLITSAKVGELVDWLGVRTDLGQHGWLTIPPSGKIEILGLPFPSDMVHAEAIEYVALIVGLQRALALGKEKFTVVELGASYGPWVTAAGVLAKRAGFTNIRMVALEASLASIPNIRSHASKNGLIGSPGVTLEPIHAAVHARDEFVFFPKVNVSHDNGAQVSIEDKQRDYRGLELEHDKVQGLCLRTICKDLDQISYMHLDLQGAEERLLADADFVDTLSSKVATFFLATQSRYIEGLALRALPAKGWILARERPTTYAFNARTSDVNGWTLRDGGQLWLNPKFGDMHLDLPPR